MLMYQKISYIFSICFICFCSCSSREKHTASPSDLQSELDQIVLNTEVEITGLLYHRFGEAKYPSTSISRGLFKEQLAFLESNNFEVVTLSEAVDKLTSADEKGKFVIITIDDAFKSFINNGFPLLQEFGFKATLFINTETVGSGDYLDWEELKFLVDNGIEIGNHTHSHAYFLDIDPADRYQVFSEEVKKAQAIIEEKLHIKPVVFAYPYGEYDLEMKHVIRDMGFVCAAAQNSGVISGYSDLYALPRFPMTDLYGKMPVFKEKIAMKALPVIKTIPELTIAEQNPPVLEIILDDIEIEYRQMQCFIQGGDCEIIYPDSNIFSYRITSDRSLTARHHLYTITVPDKENRNWYWFSFQWIFPDKKE